MIPTESETEPEAKEVCDHVLGFDIVYGRLIHSSERDLFNPIQWVDEVQEFTFCSECGELNVNQTP